MKKGGKNINSALCKELVTLYVQPSSVLGGLFLFLFLKYVFFFARSTHNIENIGISVNMFLISICLSVCVHCCVDVENTSARISDIFVKHQ